MVWTIIGGGDTQTLLAGKKRELYAHSGGVDTKTSSSSFEVVRTLNQIILHDIIAGGGDTQT